MNRIAASTTAPPTSGLTLAVSPSSNHTQSGASRTSAAQDLLLYARRLLRLSDEAVASLRQTDAAGTVRLGLPEDYAAYLLRPTLARFGQDYPLAQLELTFSSSPALLRLLETGKLDLALVTRDPRQPFAILRRERFVWAASPEHMAWTRDLHPVGLFEAGDLARRFAVEALPAFDLSIVPGPREPSPLAQLLRDILTRDLREDRVN